MKMKKVTYITTCAHNVGDDFVREGIQYLLECVFGPLQSNYIHKHIPLTTRKELEWFYTLQFSKLIDKIPGVSGSGLARRIDNCLPVFKWSDKIYNCDFLVQSGAPIYWLSKNSSCAKNEWFDPLIRRRWLKMKRRPLFFNIGGGSCQSYFSDGTEFINNERTLNYIREFFDICSLTILRDKLSSKILQIAGRNAPVLPCPSIFARQRYCINPEKPEYIVLNYMPGGGHYDFENRIDTKKR